MRGTVRQEIVPVIISQNAREEFRLTLLQGNGRKYVDMRTYIRDQESGKTIPTDSGATVNLKLWPQFREAVSSPETWTTPGTSGYKQVTHDSGRGRLIFSKDALLKNRQKQIFLEAKSFQGISFIFLRTLDRAKRGRRPSLVTIGPLLWSQFMTDLSKVEEALLDLGWLAQKGRKDKYRFRHPVTLRNFSYGR